MAGHLVEPLSAVLLVAAAMSGFVLGHVAESLAITAIVAMNAAIGTTQEARADRAIAALASLTAPTARVRRDGVTVVVPAREVVVGDLIELAAGDRVPADGDVVHAASLALDEAIITGESLPVERAIGEPVLAGTLAVRGRALAVVAATGADARIGKLASAIERTTQPPLLRELASVARRLSFVAVALGALLVPIAAVRGEGDDALGDAVLGGVALAIAAIPEGLAAVVTISLALGARTMASRGAIVRRLPALETLGATTVICTDKTGTLTTGRVAVAEVHPVVDEAAVWRAALRCIDAGDGTGDPIDVAIADAALAAGVRVDGVRVDERPFDAEARTMSTVTVVAAGTIVTVKGAPEVVLGRCGLHPAVSALREASDAMSARGLRVLVVGEASGDDLDAPLAPVGVVGFADPLRPSTPAAVEACRRAGIRLVMVTGDHVQTAVTIARAAGLDDAPAVTGAELAAMAPAEAARALRDAAVVARVEPDTKIALVEAHRAAGDIVAMTGDGVNDAPALRASDIGIALAGTAGTDVAREAADLVVTSGDLGTVVDAIREGRRTYRNIAQVVGYLVAGNLSEILVVAIALVVLPELAVPLLPVQLLWLNLVTDGLPALALGVDRTPGDPLDGPPRRVADRLLSGRRGSQLAGRAAAAALGVVLVALWARGRGWSDEVIRTELLLALLGAHLLLAYAVRSDRASFEAGWWRNRVLLAAIGGSLLLQLPMFTTPVGRDLLGLAALPPAGWLAAAVGGVAVIVAIDVARAMTRVVRARG